MKLQFLLTVLIYTMPVLTFGQPQTPPPNTLWTPASDDVYLQEIAGKIITSQPITSVGLFNDECIAVMNKQTYLLTSESFNIIKNGPSTVNRLITINSQLWALAEDGSYTFDGKKWTKRDSRTYVDMCMHQGLFHAATSEEIFQWKNDQFVSIKPEGGYYNSDITMVMEDGTQLHAVPVRLGPIHRVASYSGTLHILRPGELIQFDGKAVNTDFIDWGRLPSTETRDLLSAGSKLMISTDKGLGILRGASMTVLKGEQGLPVENTTCLAMGFDQDIWIGTKRGAVRMLQNEWQYFGADRWLPDNHVNDIITDGKKVYIATNGGLGIISYEPYTLQKKAAWYERQLDEWGHKRLGFIHMLYKKGDEWIREVSDNDGGHTATYLSAMSYKYAVTKDSAARAEAVESFKAMLWLERITPIDGFIARSIWSTTADKDAMSPHGSGGLPARWYPTADGKWHWKGDTSSDEVTAHFYSVSIFHDLVAQGKEKELAKEHLTRIAKYIMDNGWVLNDMDGKPTRWGRWNPDYLLRPYGYSDRGVNGLEVLSFMQAAHEVSGDQKFLDGYNQLVGFGYLDNTLRQKNTFPPATLAPWDDNLAFEIYATILRYVKDSKSKSVLLRSLERTYEIKRMEHIPWFNFVNGAHTGNDFDLDACMKHLRAWTLDCTEYSFENSHRDDLFVEPGYISYEGGLKAISPRESTVMRGSRPATKLDGGTNGNRIMEPTGFLRDYWMGRYYGFITAPETTNRELLEVQSRKDQKFGAEQYNGPDRPEF